MDDVGQRGIAAGQSICLEVLKRSVLVAERRHLLAEAGTVLPEDLGPTS